MSHAHPPLDIDQATRKQRREQAREARRRREAAVSQATTRRARLKKLSLVLAVVVLGIAVVVIAGSGGTRRTTSGSREAQIVDSRISSLLAGIPQQGNALGRATAPATLQYYGDLECPVCRSFTVEALPSIIRAWVRSGQLRIEYRSLETATREPEVFAAQQVAALAAGRQGRMWNFLETFYAEQGEEDSGYVTNSYLEGIARQVPGLALARWRADRSDPSLANPLTTDAQTAAALRLGGTPAFLVGPSGGAARRLEPTSFNNAAAFNGAIEAALRP